MDARFSRDASKSKDSRNSRKASNREGTGEGGKTAAETIETSQKSPAEERLAPTLMSATVETPTAVLVSTGTPTSTEVWKQFGNQQFMFLGNLL
jgi:hypothetical protein